MTDQQWQSAWNLYQRISDADKPSRNSLSQSLNGDPEVLEQVVMLLRSTHREGNLVGSSLADELQPGDQVGRFVIGELAGAGSFGRVYAARDLELNRSVALKVLHRAGEHSDSRSFREARAASALNHPSIVTIYDVVRTESYFAIAMELVEGETLRSRLARPLSLSETCRLGAQIARALAVSHAAGIIHGDLKPENIMIRGDGYVKLLDFGLAQDLDDASDGGAGQHFAGTLSYMAPELFAGRATSSASDCFAFGILLTEMTAAAPAESGRVPSSLQLLTESLMVDDPAHRPLADEVAERLEQIGIPLIQGKQRTGRLFWGMAAAAAIAWVVFWTTHQRMDTAGLAGPTPLPSTPKQSQLAENKMNAAAYNVYLQAHYAGEQHSPAGTLKAIKLYKEAIRLDPASAVLHVGLANEYMLTVEYTLLPIDKAQQMAEAEAQTASRLGETGAQGIIATFKEGRGDWKGAEAEFRKTRPNASYSLMLSLLGRDDEALQEIEQVRKKQPWALDFTTAEGTALYLAHRYESAIAEERNVLAMQPNFYGAAATLTLALLATKRPQEALDAFTQHLTPVENASYFQMLHVRCYWATGDLTGAKRVLGKMKTPKKGIYVSPSDLALAYMGVRDFDKAADLLEKAYAIHDIGLAFMKQDPLFDPMRSDPRFQKILAKMNFPR